MTQKMQKYWNKIEQAVNSEDWKQEKNEERTIKQGRKKGIMKGRKRK